jgi:hypothetical protein
MELERSSVRARLSADAPKTAVLTPMALVMGSRAGLSIQQIDDLTMAIELLAAQGQGEMAAEFQAGEGRLDLFVSDVDGEWLQRRRSMLSALVPELEEDSGGLRMRIGVPPG